MYGGCSQPAAAVSEHAPRAGRDCTARISSSRPVLNARAARTAAGHDSERTSLPPNSPALAPSPLRSSKQLARHRSASARSMSPTQAIEESARTRQRRRDLCDADDAARERCVDAEHRSAHRRVRASCLSFKLTVLVGSARSAVVDECERDLLKRQRTPAACVDAHRVRDRNEKSAHRRSIARVSTAFCVPSAERSVPSATGIPANCQEWWRPVPGSRWLWQRSPPAPAERLPRRL